MKHDSDPEAGGYVGRYFGNTKENWEKIRKVAEIVEDLIENEEKIYKYIEENGDDIFWDSFQVKIEMRENEDGV